MCAVCRTILSSNDFFFVNSKLNDNEHRFTAHED